MGAPTETEARRAALERYLAELAALVGLGDWTITVASEPEVDEDDADVYVTISPDYAQRATVRAHPRFWTEPPERQRLLATHELCHLPAERFSEALAIAGAVVGKQTMRALDKAFSEAEEHLVWWMAHRLAPSLPLPPRFAE